MYVCVHNYVHLDLDAGRRACMHAIHAYVRAYKLFTPRAYLTNHSLCSRTRVWHLVFWRMVHLGCFGLGPQQSAHCFPLMSCPFTEKRVSQRVSSFAVLAWFWGCDARCRAWAAKASFEHFALCAC